MEAKRDEWGSRPIAPQYNRSTYSQCPGITLYLHLCHSWHSAPLAKQVSRVKNLPSEKNALKLQTVNEKVHFSLCFVFFDEIMNIFQIPDKLETVSESLSGHFNGEL